MRISDWSSDVCASDLEALSRGLGVIEKNYATSVARGSMSQAAMDRAMKLITGTQQFEDIGQADIVVEAVFEEMGVKKDVFGKLDTVMKPGAVLATRSEEHTSELQSLMRISYAVFCLKKKKKKKHKL